MSVEMKSLKQIVEELRGSKLVIYNVRPWETAKQMGYNGYLAENLAGSSVCVEIDRYRKLKRTFKGFEVYVIKD